MKERKKRGGGLGEGKKHEQEWAGNSKRLKDNCWLENKNLVYKNQSVARGRNNIREGGKKTRTREQREGLSSLKNRTKERINRELIPRRRRRRQEAFSFQRYLSNILHKETSADYSWGSSCLHQTSKHFGLCGHPILPSLCRNRHIQDVNECMLL